MGSKSRSFENDNLVAAVGNACSRIREEMEVAERLQHFSLLPSTSLAIGYYNNFLRRVFEAFEHSEKIKIIEKDASGKKTAETECDIVNRYPTIEVQIPQNLVELDQDSFKRRTAGLKQIVVETRSDPFRFLLREIS